MLQVGSKATKQQFEVTGGWGGGVTAMFHHDN
jgi:hypothetical protein